MFMIFKFKAPNKKMRLEFYLDNRKIQRTQPTLCVDSTMAFICGIPIFLNWEIIAYSLNSIPLKWKVPEV